MRRAERLLVWSLDSTKMGNRDRLKSDASDKIAGGPLASARYMLTSALIDSALFTSNRIIDVGLLCHVLGPTNDDHVQAQKAARVLKVRPKLLGCPSVGCPPLGCPLLWVVPPWAVPTVGCPPVGKLR
jgi:hypothetical protein